MNKKQTTSGSVLSRLVTIPSRWFLALTIVLGAVARFIFIRNADIWHDEGYTMMLIKYNPIEIIERTARDVHPPLYYLVAHAWQAVFGNSEIAVRSLSALFGLATIVLAYLLIRRLFSEGTARVAAVFVALGPFVVRYSDEARMYGMAAFLVTLGSYLMVLIAARKAADWKLWIGYSLVIAAALYTHYYTILIVPVHVAYYVMNRGGVRRVLTDKKWWTGNLLAAGLFVPWLPVLIGQFSRVQAGFWIPPVTVHTVPETFMQFLAFLPSYFYPNWLSYLLLAVFVLVTVITYRSLSRRGNLLLLILWLVIPLVLVILLSLKRPVYYDRYFTYCSVAFYLMLAVVATRCSWVTKWRLVQYGFIGLLCLTFIAGIVSVGVSAAHRMGTIGHVVTTNYQPGDEIVSAELYTYFDFSYYNRTDQQTRLLSETPLSGYGETSLLYDKQDRIVVSSLEAIRAKRVWLVGKVGEKEYYTNKVPRDWKLLSTHEAGDSAVRLYQLN